MNKIMLLLIVVCTIIAGCESIDSIKIGGGYTGEDGTKVEGDVEVVLSKVETDYTGLNVMEAVENSSEKYVVLPQKDVTKIVEKLVPEQKRVISINPRKKLAEFLQGK